MAKKQTLKTWKDWIERTDTKRLRIGLVMTGGTIISVMNKHGALEPAKNPRDLLKYVPHLKGKADLEIIPLMNKDSTEMTPRDWVLMSQAIAKRHDEYDGFIVTHGTDTIAWSATAIRFCLGKNLRVPVVFVGSQLSLEEPRTDAVANIEDALETIAALRKQSSNEVVVVAGRKVFRGVRSVKISEVNFDFIDTPGTLPLAVSTSKRIEFSSENLSRVELGLASEKLPKIEVDAGFDEQVLAIDLTPNITPELLERILVKTNVCSGVILGSYGAGNTPVRLLRVIKQLTQNGVFVLVAPQRDGINTSVLYENARLARLAGAIQTKNMTITSAAIKLMKLLTKPEFKSSKEKLQKELLTNYYGEVSEE